MPTLLEQLQGALGKLYDGNQTAHKQLEEQENGVSHKDQYKCDCGAVVPWEDWSETQKMCVDCYLDMCEDRKFRWGNA